MNTASTKSPFLTLPRARKAFILNRLHQVSVDVDPKKAESKDVFQLGQVVDRNSGNGKLTIAEARDAIADFVVRRESLNDSNFLGVPAQSEPDLRAMFAADDKLRAVVVARAFPKEVAGGHERIVGRIRVTQTPGFGPPGNYYRVEVREQTKTGKLHARRNVIVDSSGTPYVE